MDKCKCNGKCKKKDCPCKQGKPCSCMKESKFEKFLEESVQLNEEVEQILEKLGSLDAMDASDVGLPANVPITTDMIGNAYKKLFMKTGKHNPSAFVSKLKSVFRGITPDELKSIEELLKSKVINVR